MASKDKRPIVLLGYPLKHSLSPLIHNTAFEYQGLDLRYSLHPVRPLDLERDLRQLVEKGLVGANVTVPHKQAITRLLDESSDVVETIGASNTILCDRKNDRVRLVGHNSDVGGFIAPIQDLGPELKGSQVLIFGSGGAARAVGFAVAKYARPHRIVIAARTPDAGKRLANLLSNWQPGCIVDYVRLADASPDVRNSTLLVNATPIGMGSTTHDSVWTDEDDFHDSQIVYDLIYWPLETRLMKMARGRGASALGGLEMLIEQAAISYAIWTKSEMPVDVVRKAVRRYLESRE